jgi:sulfotransferase family protein
LPAPERDMNDPILIHIGYHKTATSWLEHLIFDNPETGFRWFHKKSRAAPVHRFIRDRPFEFDADAVRAEFDTLIGEARAEGLTPVLSFGRLSGHAFSGGFDSKMIADRLKSVFPEARVLIVIREQRSVIVSTYKQYVKTGGLCNLEHFLEPAKDDWRIPEFDYRYYEYHHLIGYYQRLYGRENVLVLPYEELVRNARGFVARIAGFAGHPLAEDVLDRLPYDQRSTVAKPALMLGISRPFNRLGQPTDLNPQPLPGPAKLAELPKTMRRWEVWERPLVLKLAARSEQRLRENVAKAVGDRYVESNRKTAELTGLDLASYGWMI